MAVYPLEFLTKGTVSVSSSRFEPVVANTRILPVVSPPTSSGANTMFFEAILRRRSTIGSFIKVQSRIELK
jgi:hypothetical protein